MSSILYHTARTSSSAQRCGRHSREPGRPLCGVLRTAPLCGRLCRVPGHHPSIHKVEKRSSGEADVQSTTSLLHFSASPLFRFSTSPRRGRTDGRMEGWTQTTSSSAGTFFKRCGRMDFATQTAGTLSRRGLST
jgi:hypothetical protein